MNYYHRYSGDYIKKTLDLEMIEDGAYTRLLDWMYANERDVPHDKRYTLTRCQTPADRRAVDLVLNHYFERSGDGAHWSHERTQASIEEARPRIEAARENGKKGGRPAGSKNKPKGKSEETQEKPSGLFEGNPEQTQSESSPYPIPHTSHSVPSCDAPQSAAETDQPAKAVRGKRLPVGWTLPKAWGDWSLAEYPHWTADVVRLEADRFANYWHAKTGKDASKLDWPATWRSWCMSDICQRSHPRPVGGHGHSGLSAAGAATLEASRSLEKKLFGETA